MSAVETLAEAEAAGLRFGVDGTDLLVEADGTPPPELLDALRRDKQQILVLLCNREIGKETSSSTVTEPPDLHGLTFAEIEKLAGDHWPEIGNDPVRISALAFAIVTRQQRERGERPVSWTQICECAGCGPVYLWPGTRNKVLGCPWCFNRADGRPIPRPEVVLDGPGS